MTSSSSSSAPPLTAEEQKREEEWRADPSSAFEEGVEIAFSRWEALNIGMNNMSGGDADEKFEDFISTCIQWFLDDKEDIHWDDFEGWAQEVLGMEFHVDAQDGSCEQMGRLLCTLYTDVFKRSDFAGLHLMVRTQSDTMRRILEARRVGQQESDRRQREMKEEDIDSDEISDDDDDDVDAATSGVARVTLNNGATPASAAADEPVPTLVPVEEEQKTAEQLQDEADGWETVPVKGKGNKKGGSGGKK